MTRIPPLGFEEMVYRGFGSPISHQCRITLHPFAILKASSISQELDLMNAKARYETLDEFGDRGGMAVKVKDIRRRKKSRIKDRGCR